MRGPEVQDGWIVFPYRGPDLATVELGAGHRSPEFHHAYLDWVGGQRVAKLRPTAFSDIPQGAVTITLRVNGQVAGQGQVVL
jgi:hypothetical protein